MHDENGYVDTSNTLIRDETDIIFRQSSREEPLKPRHFSPEKRHRVSSDLIVDVVEWTLKDQSHGWISTFAQLCNSFG